MDAVVADEDAAEGAYRRPAASFGVRWRRSGPAGGPRGVSEPLGEPVGVVDQFAAAVAAVGAPLGARRCGAARKVAKDSAARSDPCAAARPRNRSPGRPYGQVVTASQFVVHPRTLAEHDA